ncbi:hypothetical protein HYY73_01650 [Candidatus Woesearchaeota archaeon]|nr:hypothetical protein [Candidatus Woesearchaeota archaeon]
MKRAQTFSTDAIIGVVLFIVAAVLLFYLSGPAASNKQNEKLRAESERLPAVLTSQQNITGVFIKSTKVDDQKLEEALNLSYESLKALLGMQSDFCIYFEDEKGNIVPIRNKIGIGSPLVNFSGKGCNETVS